MATKPHNYHLLTPLDWQREATMRAASRAGELEGRNALVEANRYGMFDAVLAYVRELERENDKLRNQVQLFSKDGL